MRLYHGSNQLFRKPQLVKCRPFKDFGKGFYVTGRLIQAIMMAERTSRLFGGRPAVMTYDADLDGTEGTSLAIRRFITPDEAWARFVMANRRPSISANDHNRDCRYDYVVGPVANDDLALLFRQFERNMISVETLVHEMQFKVLTIQHSFHTEKAIGLLKFVEARYV